MECMTAEDVAMAFDAASTDPFSMVLIAVVAVTFAVLGWMSNA